ncbi:MAG: hypothetical protein AB7G75_18335 [Candidatus Binatia bacterium]
MSTSIHVITISDKEQTLLIELLDAELNELPHEIHHTDDRDYRQSLQEKADALERLRKNVKEA